MSSVSCMVLKQPSSIFKNPGVKLDDHNILNAIMWTLGSLLVSFNVQLSQNNAGILVSVTIVNVLMMLMATLLLGKGLKESNFIYIIPWIIISTWSMYQIQLRDIMQLYQSLTDLKPVNKLPWISLLGYAFSLVVRCHLTLSVAYVALQQWFNKKLEQEMTIKGEKRI